ncbi:MAG: IclR family transcriptional regulator [Thermus aquaticus]|uniref:IclR family transcriptional regulator n=1 Tax=Thermus aquaticus TaxID=271 RepID=UPI003C0858FA
MPRPKAKGTGEVRTLERGLVVLEALSTLGEAGLGPLAAATGLSKSTLYRLLQTLVRKGFVEEAGGVYRVGPRAFAVGQAYPRQSLLEAARPEMEALAEALGESVNLGVMAGLEALYLDQVEGKKLVRLFTAPGSRAPLHATGVGKVLLAYRGVPEGLSLEAYAPHTLTTREGLLEELKRVRAQGYALDNEEKELGVRCVAAPVFGPGGEVVAALSLSAPASRLSPEEAHRLAPQVAAAARRASLRLGFTGSV